MTEVVDSVEERKSRDQARLKRVAMRHLGALLAAITLWGAADQWAISSSLSIAGGIAVLNAIFAGTVIAYLFHEWGHFAGARISGAVSPVLKEPKSFFMFNFKDDLNTTRQFLSMSAGGSVGNWLLVFLVLVLFPTDTWSQAALLATTIAIAVSVSVFEWPIINQVMYGKEPRMVIDQRLEESGKTPRNIGIGVGVVVWLLAI